MSGKKITIKDIAYRLEVTPSTVSRALAGSNRISVKTRKKVVDAARDMGYEPNVLASSLRKGKSDTIGMIVPNINRSFFSNVISGVEEILNPAGFNLIIIQTHENALKENKAIQTLLRNRVGGIIMSLSIETKDVDHLKELEKQGTPLVQFDRVKFELEGTKVVNDNFMGAYLAVKHLLKQGYKKIVNFSGSQKLNVYLERLEGYKNALEEAGIKFDRKMVFENSITRETGRKNIELAIKKLKADALFSSSDFSALGAIDGLKEMNIKIPDEFGIVGYANEPFAELMSPALTSVEQNPHEMGNSIAHSVIKSVRGESGNENITVPVRVIRRTSSQKAEHLQIV